MLLQFATGEPFATGVAPYVYQPVSSRETAHRVILNVQIGSFPTQAYLDTGAVYFVCAPEIAKVLDLRPTDKLEDERLVFRGRVYQGGLYRLPLTFAAGYGESLEVEVTAFIPQLHPEDEWPIEFPCIAGMSGCMERVRFALDPLDENIYFGHLTA
ncbi:MAG: hypothetical protein DYG89_50100 [Caldilinea sp. CFX5]|nr:hypothetical protein [Caldilinea sp. CFX5]